MFVGICQGIYPFKIKKQDVKSIIRQDEKAGAAWQPLRVI